MAESYWGSYEIQVIAVPFELTNHLSPLVERLRSYLQKTLIAEVCALLQPSFKNAWSPSDLKNQNS